MIKIFANAPITVMQILCIPRMYFHAEWPNPAKGKKADLLKN
jgi:hypothetical protein